MLVGPNTKMMLSGISKRQSAVSHCTTEAEMIAAALGLRAEAIPFQILFDVLRRRNKPDGTLRTENLNTDPLMQPIELEIMEDNQDIICCLPLSGPPLPDEQLHQGSTDY